MKKKLLLSAIVAVFAFSLVGCSSQSPDDQDSSTSEQSQEVSQEQETKTASIGESIPLTSDYGDLNITVDGFEISEEMTDQFVQYGDVSEGNKVGLLLLVVENVSYSDPYNDGIVLDPSVYVNDEDGISISVMSSSLDYGKYTGAAGGFAPDINEGQSKRFALLYQVDPEMENAEVHVADVIVDCPVEVGKRSVG